MNDISKRDLFPIKWSSDKLREMREALGFSQREFADILGVSKATISHIECDVTKTPLIVLGYSTALERAYAIKNGYIPAYRKIGTSEFIEQL